MFVVTLLVLFNFGFIHPFDIQLTGKHGYYDRYDSRCWDGKYPVMRTKPKGMKIENNIQYSNSTLEVYEDINTQMELKLEIERCRSKENPDSCESFYTFKTKKFCNLLSSKNSNWNTVVSTMEPPFVCPVKKGTYKATNAAFDLKGLPLFPVSGFWWRINTTMSDPDSGRLYSCSILETTINFVKNSKFMK